MADQKKWFKVWASILNDPAHSDMTLADVGRWTRLGAYLVSVGDNGEIRLLPPAKAFLLAMDCSSLEDLFVALKRLPNVQITPPLNGHGDFIVTMRNWYKYQVDSTYADRKKRARYKRRGEERRSTSTSPPPYPPPPGGDKNAAQPPPLGGASATRQTAGNGASTWAPTAPPPVAKVEADDEPDFGHDDFLVIGHRQSNFPVDEFQWHALERSLTDQERVRSKLREKGYRQNPMHVI